MFLFIRRSVLCVLGLVLVIFAFRVIVVVCLVIVFPFVLFRFLPVHLKLLCQKCGVFSFVFNRFHISLHSSFSY